MALSLIALNLFLSRDAQREAMKAGKEHQDMCHSPDEARHVLAVIFSLDSRPYVLPRVYRVAIYVILDSRVCLLFQRF